MASDWIAYCEGKQVEPAILQRLFREEQWNDFFELDEVAYHLETAVHVVTAWDGSRFIGYARLDGDNRLWAEISDVLVRSDHECQGIGTELVRRLMVKVHEIDPYYIQVTPIGDPRNPPLPEVRISRDSRLSQNGTKHREACQEGSDCA